MCRKCRCSLTSSHYEKEIENYILTFYSGECITNDRSILKDYEFDLYYPKRKLQLNLMAIISILTYLRMKIIIIINLRCVMI